MKRLVAILIFALSVLPVAAHEYWFEPDSFFLKSGERTPVQEWQVQRETG